MSTRALSGRRILLLEDEYFIASEVITALENAGAVVLGPVSDLERAMEVASTDFALDGAVLDINLHGEMVYPAAKLLLDHAIPVVFVTGYDCRSLPAPFTEAPCLGKPFDERCLVEVLAATCARPAVQGGRGPRRPQAHYGGQ